MILLALNAHQGPFGTQFTQIQFLLSKHPHPLLRKAEIGHTTPCHNLSNQSALGIPHMHTISTSRIHISLFVTLDTIRHSIITVRKCFAISQLSAVFYNIKLIDCSWQSRVHGKVVAIFGACVRLTGSSVCDVHFLVVRREAEAITLHKPICHTANLVCRWIETVNLRWQVRRRSEGLFIPIRRVCKPNFVVGVVDHHIVHAVERPALEIVDEGFGEFQSNR